MVSAIQGFNRYAFLIITGILLLPGATAFSVSQFDIAPPGVLNPDDSVNVTCTVYAASGSAFPSYDDLQMVTELDDPVWSYTILVNGIANERPPERGKTLTISGFELGYRNQDEVIVKLTLSGKVPPGAPAGTDLLFLKVQELDARSYIIQTTIVTYDHIIGTPTPTPTPAFGSIDIRSEPSGASVYLDNVIKGITPLTIEGVPNGVHRILLRLDGYRDSIETVNVLADTRQVTADLVQKSATPTPGLTPTGNGSTDSPTTTPTTVPQVTSSASTGTLSITTDPPGAIVYIDNEMKGITPARIPGLSAGKHSIVLIMDGYQDFKTTTEIIPGTSSEFVTGLAKRKAVPGFLFHSSLAAIGFIAALFLCTRRKNG